MRTGSWYREDALFGTHTDWFKLWGGLVQPAVIKGADKLKIVTTSLLDISVGRDPINALVLDGSVVSRTHARIHQKGFWIFKKWFIEDLGSKHGTGIYRNNITAPVKSGISCEIRTGDEIIIGANMIRIDFD